MTLVSKSIQQVILSGILPMDFVNMIRRDKISEANELLKIECSKSTSRVFYMEPGSDWDTNENLLKMKYFYRDHLHCSRATGKRTLPIREIYWQWHQLNIQSRKLRPRHLLRQMCWQCMFLELHSIVQRGWVDNKSWNQQAISRQALWRKGGDYYKRGKERGGE